MRNHTRVFLMVVGLTVGLGTALPAGADPGPDLGIMRTTKEIDIMPTHQVMVRYRHVCNQSHLEDIQKTKSERYYNKILGYCRVLSNVLNGRGVLDVPAIGAPLEEFNKMRLPKKKK